MRLLFDMNLSYKLVQRLTNEYPGSKHVSKTILGESARDSDIFMFAREKGFIIIVTQDSDFLQLVNRYGPPSKIVLLRKGNLTIAEAENELKKNKALIERLQELEKSSLLVIE